MKTFKINFKEISKDRELRNDVKYNFFIKNYTWNIFNSKNKLIKLKNILINSYKNFIFEDEEEYYGIPTGQNYIDEDGYITDKQLITKEEHPNRIKYKIDSNNILISSLRLAKSPSLNFRNLDFNKYVFSNGFYIFNVDKSWNKIFILYLLRNKKIKLILDNYLYRGIGISAYKDYDLLNIKIPQIPLEAQNKAAEQITPIENKIQELKAQIQDPKTIINEVFAEEFNFDINLYNELNKGMTAGTQSATTKPFRIFKTNFKNLNKSYNLRFSTRFHNEPTKKLMSILNNIKTIKLKYILKEQIHRGVTPEYDKNGDIPVIKIAHLKNLYIDNNFDEFISNDFYKKSMLRSQILKNDILLSSTGKISLGKIDLNENDNLYIADSHISIIRIKDYNPLFLVYFFRSVLGYFQIERDYTGSTNQIELYPKDIQNFLIPNIPLQRQQEIVDKIQTKISEQNKINDLIEKEREKINYIIENIVNL